MSNPQFGIGDLVYVRPPVPGMSGGGTGIIRSISREGDSIRYLVEFDNGQKAWYNEELLELLQGERKQTKFAPIEPGWFQNPELKESILDAWYKLSPAIFNQAYEMFDSFGTSMLEWLKETNPKLYESARVEGHKLIGIKVYQQGG